MDVETNGFGRDDEVHVVQLGWCLVENCEVTDRYGLYICPDGDYVMQEGAEAVHGISKEFLKDNGSKASEVWPQILEFVHRTASTGSAFVGHNFKYDIERMENEFRRYAPTPFTFRDYGNIIDTGAVYKAWKMGWKRRQNESTFDFMMRTLNHRQRGLKWNLDVAAEAMALGNEKRGYHDAGDDCFRCHLLIEAYREQEEMKEMLWPSSQQ